LKRQQIQIMSEILECCREPKRKTRIMYGNNLSYEQMKNYLTFLTSNELLQNDLGAYSTTVKGHHFLKAYSELQNIVFNRCVALKCTYASEKEVRT
jgi:predicted transcriptional regulator